MRSTIPILALLVASAALGACGGDDAGTGDSPTTGSVPVEADLRIVAGVAGDPAATGEAQLRCTAAGATGTAWLEATADAACAALADDRVLAAFDPTPDDVACTEIYGGDDVARITGTVTVRGATRTVDASLSRVNGCEIDRWERLASLLPAVRPFPPQ